MSRKRRSREVEVDPFYDMLFNMLIAFVFCFIIALLAMNPKALKAGDIPAKAEFIITVSWPDNNPNDLDTWVQDPAGDLVWFRAREAGLMHLDRDDRGLANDTIVVNGKQIVNPLNQEVVTLRGIAPGEYTVNIQYYETKNGEPVEATVSLVKVNPRAEVVYYGTATLARKGDEATALRFTVLPDGTVNNINTLPKTLVQQI
ncbi:MULTISPECIES: hypothetical protein [Methylibium]|uniref:hypothetical protein n=1 Tax=Methylibium TaxID=316612 RepID=UPI0003F3DD4A|nr:MULTISPECIES: hypothetical protein [Methylibium]EWS52945.1 hypothetical protein X551_04264 [Methylibium sp. T29]EWS57751.1 hypothetical protein Y694_04297 [Methylibium sp. T29-B]MBN9205339.1 hypothetical protein [Methylibium petroleiphilum]